MGKLTVYVASSWKNQHAVEMLTDKLRARGCEVLSFIENNHGEGHSAEKPIPFEEWVLTEQADRSFAYDTKGATKSQLVIYVAPSGTDAWAEVGAAWASGVVIYGLWAKGEPSGLMRKMMDEWFTDYRALLARVESTVAYAGQAEQRLNLVNFGGAMKAFELLCEMAVAMKMEVTCRTQEHLGEHLPSVCFGNNEAAVECYGRTREAAAQNVLAGMWKCVREAKETPQSAETTADVLADMGNG